MNTAAKIDSVTFPSSSCQLSVSPAFSVVTAL